MRNIKLFERELDLIIDVDLQKAVKCYMEEATPDYFWTEGASSSGKYHPSFSQGEGGLVRHTKAVVMVAEELLRLSSYAYMKQEHKDYVIAACIIHDTAKYGILEYNKTEYANHAKNAARAFAHFCENTMQYKPSEYLLDAVTAHMGQWSTDKDEKPFTSIDRCVHLADYIASRPFIDIPQITAEYDTVTAPISDLEIPF